MEWDWDPDKNRANLQKHGVAFEDAILVFEDPDNVTVEDPYQYEQRWRTIGAAGPLILTVVHTWQTSGQADGRIISARTATPSERRFYAEE